MKIKAIYAPASSDVSVNDYFDSKAIYCLISLYTFTNNKIIFRSAAEWLERPPHEREVVRSIPGRDKPVFKTGRSGFPLGAQDYGNINTTGSQVSGKWTG